MEWINKPLGYLLHLCMSLLSQYALSLVLFTLLTKIVLLPITIWTHFNSIRLVRMTPELNKLKINFFGDRDTINEKTLELYKREHYHPLLSLIPLFAQLILLMGVIDVVKKPSYAMITAADMQCFGIDFTAVAYQVGGLYYLFPIMAALSAIIMCVTQNRSHVLQAQQSNWNKYGMLVISSGLSLYLGIFVSAGVAFYWILSNLFSVLQLYVINHIINPENYIDRKQLEETQRELNLIQSSDKHLTREQLNRQKKDYKRFFSIANKHLVIYSEQSGFYKYFRKIMEWLVQHSNITIHYVTSDPNDVIFKIAEEPEYKGRIQPYFIGERRLITLFMKMDAKIVLMTTPDLGNYHLKRSYVDKNTHYIYLVHGFGSANYTLRKKALGNYDTIFCVNQRQAEEIRAHEALYDQPEKTIVYAGTGLLEDLQDAYASFIAEHTGGHDIKQVLIAPSYQPDNILESCLEPLVDAITSLGYKAIIRPHPQFVKRKPTQWQEIEEKYSGRDLVETEGDFSSNETVYASDLVVTDWSGIGYEFSLSTLKPSMYINTTRKIINPDYQKIDVVPSDTDYRQSLGLSVDPYDTEGMKNCLIDLLENSDRYRIQIQKALEDTIKYKNGSEIGGKYILKYLKESRNEK